MKRTITFILAVIMVISCMAIGINAEEAVKEEPSSWAKAEVDKAIEVDLVPENLRNGYTNGISRENLAKILSKLLDKVYGKAPTATTANFTDTTDADVLNAANLGIINGYEQADGTFMFKPENTLKRSEMAAIINRVAKLCGETVTGFDAEVTFADTESHWCKGELGWPVHNGIVKGTSDTTFSPENTLTVEQTIMMVYRTFTALKADSRTLVMIPDYFGGENDMKWYLPDVNKDGGAWSLFFGNDNTFYDYFDDSEQAAQYKHTPWGYSVAAEDATSYDVTVIDLRTFDIATVKVSNKDMKPNYIYECIDGQVVGGPHNGNELYGLLIEIFDNNECDLDKDKTELFTDTIAVGIFNGYTDAKGTPPDDATWGTVYETNVNKWLTYKWRGTPMEEFGNYTITKGVKYSSVVTVHECADGHVELMVVGAASDDGYHPEGNSWYAERRRSEITEYIGMNSYGTIATVTIVNMDKVKLGTDVSPYPGQACITYAFDSEKVTVDTNYQIEAEFDKT